VTSQSFRVWIPAHGEDESSADESVARDPEIVARDYIEQLWPHDANDREEVHVKCPDGTVKVFDVCAVQTVRFRVTEKPQDPSREPIRETPASDLTTDLAHLKRFTRDGICSEPQKRALKKAGWISWGHGMWSLTKKGRGRAETEGFL
jgi:hypothetical protein